MKNAYKNKAVILGMVLSWIFFAPLFIYLTVTIFNHFNMEMPMLMGVFFVFMPAFYTFYAFSYLPIYYAFTILGFSVILIALIWGKPSRISKITLLIGFLSIVLYPFVFSYQTAVVAADGYTLFTPTEPNMMTGLAKSAAVVAERRPCFYELHGWSGDDVLYYESVCGNNASEFWAYTVGENVESVHSIPKNLIYEIFSNEEVLEWVCVPDFYPENGEKSYRSIVVRQHDALLSNNGDLALIARHLYGPEDVLILQKTD